MFNADLIRRLCDQMSSVWKNSGTDDLEHFSVLKLLFE